MIRTALLAAAFTAATATISAQDPGRPRLPRPPEVSKIYLVNNSNLTVRVYMASIRTVLFATLAPNDVAQFPVLTDNISRVVTAFDTRTGALVSSREIQVSAEHEYDVVPPLLAAPAGAGLGPAARGKDAPEAKPDAGRKHQAKPGAKVVPGAEMKGK